MDLSMPRRMVRHHTPDGVNNATPLCIGNDCVTSSRFFNGQIDDFRIYNRVLTGTELTKIYTSGLVGNP